MSRSFIVLSLTLPPITPSMYFSRHGLSWLHSDLSTAASSELEPTITDSALQKKKNLTIHFQVISEWCGIEIDTSNLSADIFFSENFGHLLLSQARLCILTLALQKQKKHPEINHFPFKFCQPHMLDYLLDLYTSSKQEI